MTDHSGTTDPVKAAFLRCFGASSIEARDALLQEIEADAPEVAREVCELLKRADKRNAIDDLGADNAESDADEVIGSEIGPYKIREQIAEGGMGVVYVAEQTQPVCRKVALKIIRAGMSSKEVMSRFEAERQALAMMDHPNIARVLDGGTTSTGQPYFVMELVQGLPITEFADAHRMSIEERLEVFAKVCRAVQHAHRKGVIHRDLKPSNILVAEIDGEAVPKVIDFGLAKAIEQPLTEATIYTGFSKMLGTPIYMSPEQASMGVIDVDTRSDVYSAAVLLYELLTGNPPFDRETFKSASFDEVRRMIRDVEPRRPSSAVNSLEAERRNTIGDQRRLDGRRLQETLRGELDWIAMKALEKDRARRYDSPAALADDIQRYLAGEPIVAGPASARYRLRKYLNRHRVLLTATALVVLTAIAGSVVSFLNAHRATNAALRAELATTEARQATARFQELLYVADMKLASDAIADADVPRATEASVP